MGGLLEGFYNRERGLNDVDKKKINATVNLKASVTLESYRY